MFLRSKTEVSKTNLWDPATSSSLSLDKKSFTLLLVNRDFYFNTKDHSDSNLVNTRDCRRKLEHCRKEVSVQAKY